MKRLLEYINENMVGYRKMLMALLFLATCVTLLSIGLVPGDGWVRDVGLVMIAFFGANLAEHHLKKTVEIAKKIDTKKLKELTDTFKDKLK